MVGFSTGFAVLKSRESRFTSSTYSMSLTSIPDGIEEGRNKLTTLNDPIVLTPTQKAQIWRFITDRFTDAKPRHQDRRHRIQSLSRLNKQSGQIRLDCDASVVYTTAREGFSILIHHGTSKSGLHLLRTRCSYHYPRPNILRGVFLP